MPSSYETDYKPGNECGQPLDEHGKLVTNTSMYLINVPEKEREGEGERVYTVHTYIRHEQVCVCVRLSTCAQRQ